jgi:protein O-mannosyl-transferase
MMRASKGRQRPRPSEQNTPRPARAARAVYRWQTILASGVLIAMVIVTYVPALDGAFLMDDDTNIASNRMLYSLDGLRQAWFEPSSVQQYYPLVHTMFWLESRLWGFDPRGYHAVNVLLHALNVILVWRLLARLDVPGAWMAAAIFAVHPVEVESVAWAIERKNVLSLACALGSMLCYLRFAPVAEVKRREGAAAWRWYACSLTLFAAALFAKTVVLTVPAVLLVIYWWKRGRLIARDVPPLLPFVALGISLSLITVSQERNLGAYGVQFSLTIVERALVAGRALWFYAGKLAWPYPLAFFYPRFSIDAAVWWQYLFPLCAIFVPGALWFARNRIGRGPLAAVLIFAGVLTPALGFFKIYFQLFSFVANHFQYHASVALIALATAMGLALFRKCAQLLPRDDAPAYGLRNPWSAAGTLAGATLLVVLATMSFRAAYAFHDEETLNRDTIAKNPTSWIAYSHLGLALSARGQFDQALEVSRSALRLAPSRPRVSFNYGKILLDRGERNGFRPGDVDEAIAMFNRAIGINSDWAPPYVGLGLAMIRAKRLDEAMPYFNRALEIDPNNADAFCGMGLLLTETGQFARSAEYYEHALRLAPSRPDIYFGLGLALSRRGELRLAAERFSEAVRLRPRYADAWNNLGITLAQLGETGRAITCFREALQSNPDSPQAKANLSRAIEIQGQADKKP